MFGFVIHVSVIKKRKGFLCRNVMEMEMETEVFVKRLHLVNHFMVDLVEDSYKFGVVGFLEGLPFSFHLHR